MFTVEEVEAIVLGARLAQDRGDPGLARAAQDVLAKVAAVLPEPLAASLERSALLVPHRSTEELSFGPHLPELRHAVREHGKLCLDYVTERGDTTERVIWPLALFYYSHAALVGAWCELRTDYRLFRADRILSLGRTGQRFNARNGSLLQEFLHRTGHAPGNAAFDVQRNDPEN
jgi:predicted DNA-binding transcriptional regulator YafY